MALVRKATENDIPAIRMIAEQTWPATYGTILSDEQVRYMLDLFYSDAALRNLMRNGQQFLMLLDPDQKGFASFEHGHRGGKSTKINKLYVLPGMQGNGFGVQLLHEIEKEAILSGSANLILNVNRFNKAIGFYSKIGFTITGEEDIAIGSGYLMEDYIMERSLQP